jgi:hypothetical protein
MRYRGKPGQGKVKYEHGMIDRLRAALEKLAVDKRIGSIIPGVIKPRKGSGGLEIKVQYKTVTGLKCKAFCGGATQEVFVVTGSPDEIERLILETEWR